MKVETLRYLLGLKDYYTNLLSESECSITRDELTFVEKDDLDIAIEMSQGHISDLDKCIAYVNKQ